MLGAFGHNLADSLFLPAPIPGSETTTPAPLLMEFYPSGTFLKDREYAMRTLGMRYMAWWDSRYVSYRTLDELFLNPHTENSAAPLFHLLWASGLVKACG